MFLKFCLGSTCLSATIFCLVLFVRFAHFHTVLVAVKGLACPKTINWKRSCTKLCLALWYSDAEVLYVLQQSANAQKVSNSRINPTENYSGTYSANCSKCKYCYLSSLADPAFFEGWDGVTGRILYWFKMTNM